MALDDAMMRIVISTDNHLGYLEKDPVRGDDSFAAFEEVFSVAKRHNADMIVFAGDMFNDNRPSRRTMYQSLSLFKKYCCGDSTVYIANEGDTSETLKTNGGRPNFLDPYLSISLPVYTIHGNHDDPSREGGTGDALSAMDIVAASNLVNYFGKADTVDNIEITPLLISKNGVHVALYGLGAIRDERLNRMWSQDKVKFVRPPEEKGNEKYVSIFVVHQNRDYGRGIKNCIHESMIPQWMDLVIWGNEHECIPVAQESLLGNFYIYQPGSSVATSLVEGESLSKPKNIGILSVREGRRFKLSYVPYTQIRPFLYDDVNLETKHLDPTDAKIEEKIKNLLTQKAQEMIKEAREHSASITKAADELELKYRIKNPNQVSLTYSLTHSPYLLTHSLTHLTFSPYLLTHTYSGVDPHKSRARGVPDDQPAPLWLAIRW